MTIKELFEKAENGTLTYEQFESAKGDAKFVDLTEGNYVSKQKHLDELATKDTKITELTSNIDTRDSDIRALKKQLAEAGTDTEKLNTLAENISDLQKKYNADTKALQAKLDKQAYEFACREFANTKNFSSKAAKRDFTESLIAKELQFENGKILGAEDFLTSYATENSDAFVVETPIEPPKPSFSAPLNNTQPPAKKSLTELMMMKNENPEANITF